MAQLASKVEIGFDLSSGQGPFFVLDDPVAGVLDSTEWLLGGTIFYNVTEYVRSVSVDRGRNSLFSAFPAGGASIALNNHNRYFDPRYDESPFAGNIIPKREIRITTGTAIQFTGWINDWNLSYAPNGDSIADALASDATGLFAGRSLSAGTPSVEASGARVNYVLDQASVAWGNALRDVAVGETELSAEPIEAGTNAWNYLQTVAATEGGNLFVGKEGDLVFQNRTKIPTSEGLIAFGGTAIPFSNLEVIYGSENLYNEIVVSRIGGGTATAQDTSSIEEYGIRNLALSDLLFSTDQGSVDLALYYANLYSQPEYRFQSLEVALHKLPEGQQNSILNLEIGSICRVEFTPNNIGSVIDQYVEIVRINHEIAPTTHFVTLGFKEIKYQYWILSDPAFGKLSGDNRLGDA